MLLREDLVRAIGKMRNKKAGISFGIFPEMVKAACCEEEFLISLLDLVCEVWKECQVPKDWSNAVIISILKRGDLS